MYSVEDLDQHVHTFTTVFILNHQRRSEIASLGPNVCTMYDDDSSSTYVQCTVERSRFILDHHQMLFISSFFLTDESQHEIFGWMI